MTRGEYGRWEVTLPAKDGQLAVPHGSKVKVGALNPKHYVMSTNVEHRFRWSYLRHMNVWNVYLRGSLVLSRT